MQDIWMAWYLADYLRDTRHLTCLEHGAYRQMIDYVYLNAGRLSVTDADVIRMLNISEAEWQMIRDRIRAFFCIRGNTWTHKRVTEELRKAASIKEKRRERTANARAAALQKRHSVTDNVTGSVTSVPSPSPSPSPRQSLIDKGKTTKPSKLSRLEKELADRIETLLAAEWVNDAGKWIGRIKTRYHNSQRVIAEVENAAREGRIKTTPAAYAEYTWNEFTK